MSQDLEALRKEIVQMHDFVKDSNYYEIFEIDRETESEALKKLVHTKFRELVRKWHVDRFNNPELGDYREKVQQIFATLNKGHQVLMSDNKRAEYDQEVFGTGGQDIGAILYAEQVFRKGQSLLDLGSYQVAYERFQEAAESNPDEPQFQAHLLFAEYLLLPCNKDGIPTNKKRMQEISSALNAMKDQFNEHDWMHYFLGVVSKGLGDITKARRYFTAAVRLNPLHHSAKRELRIIQMRKGSSSAGGSGAKKFFAQVMEKFKR